METARPRTASRSVRHRPPALPLPPRNTEGMPLLCGRCASVVNGSLRISAARVAVGECGETLATRDFTRRRGDAEKRNRTGGQEHRIGSWDGSSKKKAPVAGGPKVLAATTIGSAAL